LIGNLAASQESSAIKRKMNGSQRKVSFAESETSEELKEGDGDIRRKVN
jgi:hypothetical protein